MWRFFVAASYLLVACHAQYRGARPFGSTYSFPTGGMIDFTKFNSLEGICNAAVMTSGVTDHLSDVMRNAVQYKVSTGANLMTMGGMGRNSGKWNCLIGAATKGYTNPSNAANGVGDYFDTATELRIQPFLPFKYNPCEMVFCGEQGMTPAAMAREVLMRLRTGMPLGTLSSVFGSHASQLMRGGGRRGGMHPPMPNVMGGGGRGGMHPPMPNMMGGGGMGGMMGRGMNPMMPPMNPMGGGMFGMSGMPNMPGMPSMPNMGNMGGVMQRMQNMMKMMGNGGGPSMGMAKKTPSSNALSTNPNTDPTAASLDTNATGNTVTTKTNTKPAPAPSSSSPSSSSSSSSSGTSMSNSLPGGTGMMSNPFKAMGMPGGMPPMGGGGMGMPGMGMSGMGMPGMGMSGMGMPGMGMPGMGMPGMGMGMMGMPGMGGMGMGGMGGMGNMLSAMMTAEYLMDMPDPPAYGMRGSAYGGMGSGQLGMGGQMGGMGGMPPPPPPPPPMSSSYRHRSARPPPPPPPPHRRHRPPMSSSMGRPAMRTAPNYMGALPDIFNMMG